VLNLQEQTAFVVGQLAGLGRWIGMPRLAESAVELSGRLDLKSEIESAVSAVPFFRTKSWDGVLRLGLYRAAQYALVRATGARTAIETGVLHGLSSAFLLEGLAANGGGTLHSIDLPSTYEAGPSNADGFNDTLPPAIGPGWAIPQRLRPLWDLRLGKSADRLPELLDGSRRIDVFVHDSEHTFETMMSEFEAVWPHLRTGGVLIADNIDCNTAFFDFARSVGVIAHVMPTDPDHLVPGSSGIRFGVLIK